MNYSKEQIKKVCDLVKLNSTPAYNYVSQNMPEWLYTLNAIFTDDKPLAWLVKNQFILMAAFVKAVEGEGKSIQLLMKSKCAHLAATANVINRDENAEKWLRQHNLEHFAELGIAIREKLDDQKPNDFSVFYKGPI